MQEQMEKVTADSVDTVPQLPSESAALCQRLLHTAGIQTASCCADGATQTQQDGPNYRHRLWTPEVSLSSIRWKTHATYIRHAGHDRQQSTVIICCARRESATAFIFATT